MKKLFVTLTIAATALVVNAQERGFYGNKFTDNWYIGAEYGLTSMTAHQAVFKNLNQGVGLKLGKYFSPIFGIGLEGNAYFSNKAKGHNLSGDNYKGINYYQIGIFANANLMNAIKSYYGEPRRFEIMPMIGFYWGHNNSKDENELGTHRNTLVNKLAVDFCYNIGKKKMFQVFVEPSFNFAIAGAENEDVDAQGVGNEIVKYDINNSFLGLNVGINYKFLTSNGTHNFMVVEACDQTEIDDLNSAVNSMRSKSTDDEGKMAELQKENERLRNELKACQDKPDTVVAELPLLPVVFFPLNKSVIEPNQEQNVEATAGILKNHPEVKININGYASPEGPHANNTKLAENRAKAVKDLLVNKYGISADRITTQGCGETDQLYKTFELNRVAILTIQK